MDTTYTRYSLVKQRSLLSLCRCCQTFCTINQMVIHLALSFAVHPDWHEGIAYQKGREHIKDKLMQWYLTWLSNDMAYWLFARMTSRWLECQYIDVFKQHIRCSSSRWLFHKVPGRRVDRYSDSRKESIVCNCHEVKILCQSDGRESQKCSIRM